MARLGVGGSETSAGESGVTFRATFAAITCCALLGACDETPYETATYARPADVKSFFNIAEQCQHWAGEEAYDAARGKEILQAVHRLRCETLEDVYVRLHMKYADDATVIADMETTNSTNDFEFVYPPK